MTDTDAAATNGQGAVLLTADESMPPDWNSSADACGTVGITGPNRTGGYLTPTQAVALGWDLIRSAMEAMDAELLRKLGVEMHGNADFIDDYAGAMRCCPRCGDGPYPES